MKGIFTIALILSLAASFAQTPVARSSNAVTAVDQHVKFQQSMSIPAPYDTISVNGLDSVGSIIYARRYSGVYIRDTFPGGKKWTRMLKSGDAGTGVQTFNGRSGTVTLNSADVDSALGYVPPNPNGTNLQYIAGDGSKVTFPTIPAQFNPIQGYGILITGSYPNKTFVADTGTLFPAVRATISGGVGISSLNGLTGATQTFATGTAGTNFNISSSGTTHTFNTPVTSATNTGLVTPTLFNTWNGKQNALSGTGYSKWAGSTPSYLTPTQVTADLNIFSSSLQGLVPASGGGTTNFLRADGSFAVPPGTGGGGITALTGPVTASGTGSVATTITANAITTTTINNNAVTYAKIQQVSAGSLLGNPTGSTANVSEITLGTNLSFSGSVLNATGGGGSTTLNRKAVAYGSAANTVSGDTLQFKHDSLTNGHTYLFVNTPPLQYDVIVGFGNSITVGLGASSTYYAWLTTLGRYFSTTVNNQGLSSSTLENRSPTNPFGAANGVSRSTGLPAPTSSKSRLINSYGVNDVRYNGANYTPANFAADYQTVINNEIALGWTTSQLVMLSTSYLDSAGAFLNFGSGPATYARQAQFDSTIKAVAATNNILYIDIRTPMIVAGGITTLSPDGTHPSNRGHLIIARTVAAAMDTVRIEGQRFAVDGKAQFGNLSLKRAPVLAGNSAVLGVDTANQVGVVVNGNFPGNLVVGNTQADADPFHAGFVNGAILTGGVYANGVYPGGGSIPANSLIMQHYSDFSFGTIYNSNNDPLFFQQGGGPSVFGGAGMVSDGTLNLFHKITQVMDGQFGIADMSGAPIFFTSGTHLEEFYLAGVGYILPYTRGTNVGSPLALNYTGGAPVYIGNNADNGTSATLQITGNLSVGTLANGVAGTDSVLVTHLNLVKKVAASSFGGALSNLGAAYRAAVAGTSNVKTFSASRYLKWDSATTGQLNVSLDTTTLFATLTDSVKVRNLGSGQIQAYGLNQTLGVATITNALTNSDSSLTITAAGSNTQVQYNNSGAFAGSANFKWINGSNSLVIGNISGTFIQNLFIQGSGATTGLANTAGSRTQVTAGTYTDNATASSGTATYWGSDLFNSATLAASNTSVTYTNAATIYVKAPTAGTNITITNPLSVEASTGNISIDAGNLQTNSIRSNGLAPAIAAGTGAGTSPTISISGSDMAGTITLTTGTLPTLSATIATITYNVPYGIKPHVVLTPVNSNAALLSGVTMVYVNDASSSNSVFVLTAGTTALSAATAYTWYYQVIQ